MSGGANGHGGETVAEHACQRLLHVHGVGVDQIDRLGLRDASRIPAGGGSLGCDWSSLLGRGGSAGLRRGSIVRRWFAGRQPPSDPRVHVGRSEYEDFRRSLVGYDPHAGDGAKFLLKRRSRRLRFAGGYGIGFQFRAALWRSRGCRHLVGRRLIERLDGLLGDLLRQLAPPNDDPIGIRIGDHFTPLGNQWG